MHLNWQRSGVCAEHFWLNAPGLLLQADAQIHLAAEAVIAIKKQAFEKETRGELKIQSEHAAEVLAAQIPRLELYASIKVKFTSICM